ncbi:MAG: hypothetical protein R3B93_23335 [Bacteroidia bacterium]
MKTGFCLARRGIAFDSIEEIEVERTSRFYEKDGHFLFRKGRWA